MSRPPDKGAVIALLPSRLRFVGINGAEQFAVLAPHAHKPAGLIVSAGVGHDVDRTSNCFLRAAWKLGILDGGTSRLLPILKDIEPAAFVVRRSNRHFVEIAVAMGSVTVGRHAEGSSLNKCCYRPTDSNLVMSSDTFHFRYSSTHLCDRLSPQ